MEDIAAFAAPSLSHEEPHPLGAATFGKAAARGIAETSAFISPSPVFDYGDGDDDGAATTTTEQQLHHPHVQDSARSAKHVPQASFGSAPARGSSRFAADAYAAPAPAHAFSSASSSAAAVAAATGKAGTFGGSARDASAFLGAGGGVAATGDLLAPEVSDSVKPHKPHATFGTGAARPIGKSDLSLDAPPLHPSVDSVKPRSDMCTAVFAPPDDVAPSASAAPAPPPPPGPGAYQLPPVDAVSKRAPSAALMRQPTAKPRRRRSPSPPPLPPPSTASADASSAAASAAPFNSSTGRGLSLSDKAVDSRRPLELAPAEELIRKAAPSFSFSRSARTGVVDAGRVDDDYDYYGYYDEQGGEEGGAEYDGWAEDEDGGWWDEEAEPDRKFKVVERRAPAATFGSAPRFKHLEPSRVEDASGDDEDEDAPRGGGPPPPSTPIKAKGGLFGKAPRFPGDPAGRRDEVPFSPTASTVLSDAATDIAPLHDVADAALATRPRAPAAVIHPERTTTPRAGRTRQAQIAARLGPGRYTPNTEAIERRVPGVSFGTPARKESAGGAEDGSSDPPTPSTIVRQKRREAAATPGPGSYAPPSMHGAIKPKGGLSWGKMSGREPTAAAKAKEKAEKAAAAAAAALKAQEEAKAAKEAAAAKAKALPTFGSAPRTLNLAPKTAVENVPYYQVKHSAVEPSAKGGSWGRPSSSSGSSGSRARAIKGRSELLKTWRHKRAMLEALLRGELHESPRAPADVMRASTPAVRFYPPSEVAPRHAPIRHRSGVPNDAALKAERSRSPEAALRRIKPKEPSYSFGKAAARLKPIGTATSAALGPVEHSSEAAEARLALTMMRAPAAIWGKLTAMRLTFGGGLTSGEEETEEDESGDGALDRPSNSRAARAFRKRLKRERADNGDTIVLDLGRAQLYLRAHLPGFRYLLPTTTPRRALVPRPPWPGPPLAPVLLLPPSKSKHIATVFLGPRRHMQRARIEEMTIAMNGGFGADDETAAIPFLSLDELSAIDERTEPSIKFGTFGGAERFDIVKAAARLLPEGCVLELHPSYDLVLPHHGVLVNMGASLPSVSGARVAPTNPIEELLPGPGTYDAAWALLKPGTPSIDFAHAPNPRAISKYDALGTEQALQPSAATYDVELAWLSGLMGRRAPSVFFGTEERPIGGGGSDQIGKSPMGEGEPLLLLQLCDESRETGRPMWHEPNGGAMPLSKQVGRGDLPPPPGAPTAGADHPLSGGDYDVNERPVRHRWPVVDFGSGPGREAPGGAFELAADVQNGLGDVLDLDPQPDYLKYRSPAVDFGQAPGRADLEPPSEPPRLLELNPQPEFVMPSHPTLVVMTKDPNEPPKRRQRPKRWPVVKSEGDALLDSIERHIAEAGPPPVVEGAEGGAL